MKNILNYFYQIIISEDKINDGYFSYHNHLFHLCEYHRNLDEIDSLVNLNNYMINGNICINRIIFNIFNRALTNYENKYYVLLLETYQYNSNYFKFIPIINSNNFNILKRNNWDILWERKVDFVEYQLLHIEKKYPLLYKSVHYYIGLSENAISYFKMLRKDNLNLYINHRRINKNDLYNPLELVLDYKVRDVAEYLKKCFFAKHKTIYEIKKYFYNLDLDDIDYYLLYTRMLFPSYYFDVYDEIINNHKEEKEILTITNLVNDYEELLYELYLMFNRRVNLIGIDWINQKFK